MQLHLVDGGAIAVEDDELAALQLVIDQLAHIVVVGDEAARVGEHELLVDDPVFRHGVIEQVQHPHAIILDHHALGVHVVQPLGQVFAGQLAFIVQHMHVYTLVRELVGRVFLLALLADQQQRALAVAEALVLQGLLDEFRLAGLKKAGEQINGNILLLAQT